MNPLKQLEACGQSPWLDNLSRGLILDGGLKRLIEQDGVKGVTSNPSIFKRAIVDSDEYSQSLARFQELADHDVSAIYEHLVISDIQSAADALRAVYEKTQARDGYVSLECSPYIANDAEATEAEALRLWSTADRPNLMVKVPATPAGLVAIRRLVGRGVNVNVTLLFSIAIYEEVVEAYLAGLEAFAGAGGDLARIGGVTSFFVSRIDRAIDARLEALGPEARTDRLRGRAGIACARIAYGRYAALFSTPRWRRLAAAGARTQRLLWASTSASDPRDKAAKYVEALIGRDTVNTMAPATMEAFRDHGEAEADAILTEAESAHALLAELDGLGVSVENVAAALLQEGERKFVDDFDALLGAIAHRRGALLKGSSLDIGAGSPELAAAFASERELWRAQGKIRRLWAGDASLWTGGDESKWMGWLGIVEKERRDLDPLRSFARESWRRGVKDIVLLGMGGSSLGPEVLAEIFDAQPGRPKFHMLDSTDPAQIRTIEHALDLARTLFVVSSKSGATLEPNLFLDYFLDRVRSVLGGENAGEAFVAVTDPGSPLEGLAKTLRFAHIFKGEPSIGGRYSVLSKFGLAPSAAIGIDVERLLETARAMQHSCGPDAPSAENPGLVLGVALGIAATCFRRDKVTIFASEGLAPFGAWLEQLLAESTGKSGRGLIPLAGEPVAGPERYGADRFFVHLRLAEEEDAAQVDAVAALASAGHPVARISVKDVWSLGGEFFRWEVAVAFAGSILAIDPFNQPDVEASKLNTRAMMEDYARTRSLPSETPIFRANGLALYADPRNARELGRHNGVRDYLRSHFSRVNAGGPAGDYVALLAYLERNEAHTRTLTAMRGKIRDKTRAATCLGFGPRFQHSTGQAFKGGPNSGVFLQITCDDPEDIDIPGRAYSFGVVKVAQAAGDLAALVERGRRVLRVHLKDVDTGLAELSLALDEALA
jgi:transaldolase/glucose-6-phosphate isomerase